MEKAGLVTKQGHAVPLLGVKVEAEVLGGHARVVVKQRYKNTETAPIEAVYTFPLPADGTLTAFAMVCEGRKLAGVVKEREQAFRDYDEAIVQGHGAALLEQERANVFTATVGNLLPNEETVIEVEYLQRLSVDEGALRFMLPTLVAPRYVPGNAAGDRTGGGFASPTDRVPDADRITPRIGDVAYGLALELVFAIPGELEVESPSHHVVATRHDGRVKVTFQSREVALDRDVVVIARGAGQGPIAGAVADRRGSEPGTFALTVVPDLGGGELPAPHHDVVFLVDTSGSMGGDSLPQAQAALKLCLRHLRAGDRFDVVAFQSSSTAFRGRPTAFDQSSLEAADRWVQALFASGGTELLAPLVEAVRSVPDGIVVLLTDGQVGNEREILEQVVAARGTAKTRVYSFGIGTNVSDALLRDLARTTGGGVEFIHPGERIDDKVVATFAKALAPRVEDVTVRFVGVEAGELAPQQAAPLVDGEGWTLFGRYASPGRGRAEIRGTFGGKPWALDVTVDLPPEAEHRGVRQLWAKERIAELEQAEVSGRRAGLMKERIVRLAVENGISSPYTSFLVVEERVGDRRAHAQPQTRFVPVNAPAGWDLFKQQGQTASGGGGLLGAAPGRALSSSVFGAPRMPPASGSMPPPPARSPMMAPAPAMPSGVKHDRAESTAAPADAKGTGGGMLERAKKLLSRPAKEEAAPAPMRDFDASFDLAPSAPLEAAVQEPSEGAGDRLRDLFSRQLASGLWPAEGAGTEELRLLRGTMRAFKVLVEEGVTTAHPLYGAPAKKAVEAVLELAARLAAVEPKLVEAALAAAWLVATGKRLRDRVGALVKGAAAPIGALPLADEAALRARVGATP